MAGENITIIGYLQSHHDFRNDQADESEIELHFFPAATYDSDFSQENDAKEKIAEYLLWNYDNRHGDQAWDIFILFDGIQIKNLADAMKEEAATMMEETRQKKIAEEKRDREEFNRIRSKYGW